MFWHKPKPEPVKPPINWENVWLNVAIPTSRGVHPQTIMTFMRLAEALQERGARTHRLSFSTLSSVAIARGFLAKRFLEDLDMTHLLQLDDDISCDPEVVIRMIEAGLPMVGCTYRQRRKDGGVMYPLLASESQQKVRPGPDGTAVVDGIPGGLTLWRREAIEELDDATPRVDCQGTVVCGFYFERVRPNGLYVSEDYSSCDRWRELGHEVRLLVDATISHHDADTAWRGNYKESWGIRLLPQLDAGPLADRARNGQIVGAIDPETAPTEGDEAAST